MSSNKTGPDPNPGSSNRSSSTFDLPQGAPSSHTEGSFRYLTRTTSDGPSASSASTSAQAKRRIACVFILIVRHDIGDRMPLTRYGERTAASDGLGPCADLAFDNLTLVALFAFILKVIVAQARFRITTYRPVTAGPGRVTQGWPGQCDSGIGISGRNLLTAPRDCAINANPSPSKTGITATTGLTSVPASLNSQATE